MVAKLLPRPPVVNRQEPVTFRPYGENVVTGLEYEFADDVLAEAGDHSGASAGISSAERFIADAESFIATAKRIAPLVPWFLLDPGKAFFTVAALALDGQTHLLGVGEKRKRYVRMSGQDTVEGVGSSDPSADGVKEPTTLPKLSGPLTRELAIQLLKAGVEARGGDVGVIRTNEFVKTVFATKEDGKEVNGRMLIDAAAPDLLRKGMHDARRAGNIEQYKKILVWYAIPEAQRAVKRAMEGKPIETETVDADDRSNVSQSKAKTPSRVAREKRKFRNAKAREASDAAREERLRVKAETKARAAKVKRTDEPFENEAQLPILDKKIVTKEEALEYIRFIVDTYFKGNHSVITNEHFMDWNFARYDDGTKVSGFDLILLAASDLLKSYDRNYQRGELSQEVIDIIPEMLAEAVQSMFDPPPRLAPTEKELEMLKRVSLTIPKLLQRVISGRSSEAEIIACIEEISTLLRLFEMKNSSPGFRTFHKEAATLIVDTFETIGGSPQNVQSRVLTGIFERTFPSRKSLVLSLQFRINDALFVLNNYQEPSFGWTIVTGAGGTIEGMVFEPFFIQQYQPQNKHYYNDRTFGMVTSDYSGLHEDVLRNIPVYREFYRSHPAAVSRAFREKFSEADDSLDVTRRYLPLLARGIGEKGLSGRELHEALKIAAPFLDAKHQEKLTASLRAIVAGDHPRELKDLAGSIIKGFSDHKKWAGDMFAILQRSRVIEQKGREGFYELKDALKLALEDALVRLLFGKYIRTEKEEHATKDQDAKRE